MATVKRYSGTVGAFYENIDFYGYRGWLTCTATSKVYKFKTVINSSIPLETGDSVYYYLKGGEAVNVKKQ